MQAMMVRRIRTSACRWSRLGILILLSSGLIACSGLVGPSIEDVLKNPNKYLNTEVTVVGRVTNAVKLPFFPGVYWVDDGSGSLPVVTPDQPPAKDLRVRVRGRVEYIATLEMKSVGLHIAEVWRR